MLLILWRKARSFCPFLWLSVSCPPCDTSTGPADRQWLHFLADMCVVRLLTTSVGAKWHLMAIFIFISLITDDIEQLIMSFLVIRVPSLVMCLFKSFAQLKKAQTFFYCWPSKFLCKRIKCKYYHYFFWVYDLLIYCLISLSISRNLSFWQSQSNQFHFLWVRLFGSRVKKLCQLQDFETIPLCFVLETLWVLISHLDLWSTSH